MKSVTIYYTQFDREFSSDEWQHYFQLLSTDQQERNKRYHRWQDRHAHLLGRMLLANGWRIYEQEGNPLTSMQYNAYSRPFIDGNIDFNISHAGNYVICAIGEALKLGVDIEQCRELELELEHYENTMNVEQWVEIHNAITPSSAFFRYWVMKEAVIKADGKGLSIGLSRIFFEKDVGIIENDKWYLQRIDIAFDYEVWLACSVKNVSVILEKCHF